MHRAALPKVGVLPMTEFVTANCGRCGAEFTTKKEQPDEQCVTCRLAERTVRRLSKGSAVKIWPDIGEPYVTRLVHKGDAMVKFRDVDGHETAPANERTYPREQLIDHVIRDDVQRVQQCRCGKWYSYNSPGQCFSCAVGLDA